MNDDRTIPAETRATDRHMRRDPCVDAVCQLLIQAGVSPDRIRVGGTFDHLGFLFGPQYELPVRAGAAPQMLLRTAAVTPRAAARTHDHSKTNSSADPSATRPT